MSNRAELGSRGEILNPNSDTYHVGQGNFYSNNFIPEGTDVPNHIDLITSTWARESHGLFDYEAKHPIRCQLTGIGIGFTRNDCAVNIVRKGTEVKIVRASDNNPDYEPLAKISMKFGPSMAENRFYVDVVRDAQRTNKSGKLWRVVRESAPQPGVPEHTQGFYNGNYTLAENDAIKLGRFKLRVRQIVTCNRNAPISDSNGIECMVANVNPHSTPPRSCNTSEAAIKELEMTPCRICLLEGSSKEDPLIKPCECKGTIEYVHLACLRHWVKGKLDLAEGQCGSYFYKPMSCELCKTQYATHMQDFDDPESKKWPLLELPKTTPPFICLERDSNRPELKGVHVISLAEKKLLKLGRGHESDVRFADVSISRWHASVNYDGEKHQFVLADHKSKFGTLVAMKTPVGLDLAGEAGMSLQAGRTVLSFVVKEAGKYTTPSFNVATTASNSSDNENAGHHPQNQQGFENQPWDARPPQQQPPPSGLQGPMGMASLSLGNLPNIFPQLGFGSSNLPQLGGGGSQNMQNNNNGPGNQSGPFGGRPSQQGGSFGAGFFGGGQPFMGGNNGIGQFNFGQQQQQNMMHQQQQSFHHQNTNLGGGSGNNDQFDSASSANSEPSQGQPIGPSGGVQIFRPSQQQAGPFSGNSGIFGGMSSQTSANQQNLGPWSGHLNADNFNPVGGPIDSHGSNDNNEVPGTNSGIQNQNSAGNNNGSEEENLMSVRLHMMNQHQAHSGSPQDGDEL